MKTFLKAKPASAPVAPFKSRIEGKVTPQLMKAVTQSEKRATEADLAQLGEKASLTPPAANVMQGFPDMTGFLSSAPIPYAEPYRPAVWMNAAEAAKHLKSSVVKLGKLRTLGEGPKCYKQPDGAVLYEQYDLDRWVRSMPTIGSEY